ncbi:MAG: PDZ domain-containing protein [Sporanaerobacter sp.]|jgi:hypothetical protein|uniref:PDZ domain-containing protein n=1 Tax=Sporanaerobacter sp. TaxID=2010183 RepID=UPI003A0FEEB8
MFELLYSLLSSLKSPIYWIVVAIVIFQYKKLGKMEKMILGSYKEPLYKKAIASTVLGLLGGMVGSIVFMILGTRVNSNDFIYILPLAILLSLIHPRFICFSYAGGIVSLISLLFGYPKINIISVMTIVAVLHLIEAFLIILDGHNGKIPIFMEKDNEIVGGFNMNRFWPVPFLVFLEGYGVMPVTVIAVLGYGDFALTKHPKDKTKETASMLFIFSAILLILSELSKSYSQLLYVLAIVSPVFHEMIIQMGRKRERLGKAIFTPSQRGLKLLDTMPYGVGEKMGLKTGDIILSINGNVVQKKEDVLNVLRFSPKYIWIDVLNENGKLVTLDYKDYRKGIQSLDVLFIPEEPDYSFVVEEVKSPLSRLLKRIKRKGLFK